MAPTLNIHARYDDGTSQRLRDDVGRLGQLLGNLKGQKLSINSSTEIWCSITDWSQSPSVTTTCNHRIYTNNCESTGIRHHDIVINL